MWFFHLMKKFPKLPMKGRILTNLYFISKLLFKDMTCSFCLSCLRDFAVISQILPDFQDLTQREILVFWHYGLKRCSRNVCQNNLHLVWAEFRCFVRCCESFCCQISTLDAAWTEVYLNEKYKICRVFAGVETGSAVAGILLLLDSSAVPGMSPLADHEPWTVICHLNDGAYAKIFTLITYCRKALVSRTLWGERRTFLFPPFFWWCLFLNFQFGQLY